MNKISFISGAIALVVSAFGYVSCDDAEEGIRFNKTVFPVGEVVWRNDVSSADRAVISNLVNNMVKVERCQFYMGAQGQSLYRANYSSSFTQKDTVWYNRFEHKAYWRDLKSKDTLWFNADNFHFVDSIKQKRDTLIYAAIYRNGSAWVGPVVEVSMDDYYIGKYEITQQEWMAVMHKNPTGQFCIKEGESGQPWYKEIGKGDKVAAYNIWYTDAKAFCDSLTALTGLQFRLPTEAEWECAARGGKYSRGYRYAGTDSYSEAGWVYNNSAANKMGQEDYGIHAGGEKLANELGIYDMCGNVSEWVANSYYRYGCTDTINPQGKSPLLNGQDTLILRGGSWMQQKALDFNPANRKCCVLSTYSSEESLQSAFVNCGFRICISAQ